MILKPYLKFQIAKYRYYRQCTVDFTLTNQHHHLQQFLQDGLLILENFLKPSQLLTVLKEVREKTDLYENRKEQGKQWLGNYRIAEIDRLVPSSRSFFENPQLMDLVKAYMSETAESYSRALVYKTQPGERNFVHLFHFDDWKHRVKAFLYLFDVGPNEAPMVYLKGSHRSGLWRQQKEQEYFDYFQTDADGRYLDEAAASCGCYLLPEVRNLQQRYGFQEHQCIGKAGTVVLFDTRGLHRASVLNKNSRLVLMNAWKIPEG